jgi:alpha-L-rhamnosidase
MKRTAFAAVFTFGAAFAAQLVPYALQCEARSNPLGIDTPHPRLSWKLRAAERGQAQTAYRILVASTPEKLSPGGADLWDSGRVSSAETTWIQYQGASLETFQRYWWKVGVWGAPATGPAWSEPAQWTMAAVDSEPWKAAWIAHPDDRLRAGPLPVFRHEFSIDRPLRRALAFVSGLGFYEFRINGTRVGDHVLAPAWTDYRQTVLYESFDVTDLLKSGPNALGVLLGNGFFNVPGGRYAKFTASFGRPRLFLQLHLEFRDGTTREVISDSDWRIHDGPITFSCIYGGEDFDARLELRGWDQPGFDDSSWPHAASVGTPGELRSQSSPPVRVQETFPPVRITEPTPGVFVYDLGQNFSGWPKLAVSGPAGATVRLTPGELLDTSGMVTQRSSGGPTFFSYTLRGSGRGTWAPRFSYTGFRYLQVEGAAPESAPLAGIPVVHQLEGEFLHLDAARTGHFACSNELFNRVHALVDAAIRSNLQHVLTDCPHREKLGWLEVSYLMGPSLLYGWDLRAFLPKIARDIRETQTSDGLFPDVAPMYSAHSGGFRDSPEWGSAGVLVPWLAWEWYGDREPLEKSYRAMKDYVHYLTSRADKHLLLYGLGDWYDIGPGAPGPSKLTPKGVTATATYIEDLRVLERAARLLGRTSEARNFAAQRSAVHEAFQNAYYGKSTYASSSQTALAMPLTLGLAPPQARTALVEQLVADVRRRGNHPSAGDIGYRYVLKALLDAGRSDVIFDMTNRRDPPSYGAQLAAGATSLTEAWDADPESSQNHCMLGHIDEWFYAGLAGIRPDPETPGLRHVTIYPEFVGDVKTVDASWETLRGTIVVRWRKEQPPLRLTLDIPPGITADVFVPAPAQEAVLEGGLPWSKAAGLRFLRRERGRTVFEVQSGHYDFQVAPPGDRLP